MVCYSAVVLIDIPVYHTGAVLQAAPVLFVCGHGVCCIAGKLVLSFGNTTVCRRLPILQAMAQGNNIPTFREALVFWLKLGWISFGGPAGQIALMHDFLVERKRWVSPSKFLHALNYCMLLPGPEAQQLATYIGWLLHGVRGGLAAGLLFIAPSVCILLVLSTVYAVYGSVQWVAALFGGLKPAVVAIVVLALYRVAVKSLSGVLPVAIALLAFLALAVVHIPFPAIILAALVVGAVYYRVYPHGHVQAESKELQGEVEYVINSVSHRNLSRTALSSVWKNAVAVLCVCAVLWILPLVLLVWLAPDGSFWQRLVWFFTRAAFITFGGAYAVLPYVAQVSVERFGWLSRLQMIDGLAMGETTPGPLVMILAFVGFMGGYNHFGGSVGYGALGLLTTVYYTFLPCFFFIFAGAPFIERTQGDVAVKSVLRFVAPAVVGVMLSLALYFGAAVLFPYGFSLARVDWFALVWILLSLVALYRFRVNMILWIAVSAVAGLVAMGAAVFARL